MFLPFAFLQKTKNPPKLPSTRRAKRFQIKVGTVFKKNNTPPAPPRPTTGLTDAGGIRRKSPWASRSLSEMGRGRLPSRAPHQARTPFPEPQRTKGFLHLAAAGRGERRAEPYVQREWGRGPPRLTCACCTSIPTAHCPPHPRSDCSVLRLPFAVLFCKAGRGQGGGGWPGQARGQAGGTEERAWGQGGQRAGGAAHGKEEKAESVSSDTQEILRQGFLRQNVTIKKKFKKQKHRLSQNKENPVSSQDHLWK